MAVNKIGLIVPSASVAATEEEINTEQTEVNGIRINGYPCQNFRMFHYFRLFRILSPIHSHAKILLEKKDF